MAAQHRIPVLVLAGFLGSGKTTLLNHLLRGSGRTRIGVLVNDFGSIEVDAMTVAGQVDSMVSLGDGCLCCAVDTEDLDEALEVLARPSADLDVLVIEASGLAEPQTLVRMVLAGDSPHVRYGGLVEVVDAAEFTATRARHPEIDRHVAVADLVVLNKADRAGEEDLRAVEETVASLAPGTPLVRAVHGRVDPDLLFDRPRRPRPPVEQLSFDQLLKDDAAHHHPHLHEAYTSVEFTADTPLDPRRLLAFLDARPPGLYRIKGFLDLGTGERWGVHAVGGFLRFTPERWRRDEPRRTQLVLIGTGLDADALRDGLAACAAETGRAPAPEELWGVLRYVDAHDDGGVPQETSV